MTAPTRCDSCEQLRESAQPRAAHYDLVLCEHCCDTRNELPFEPSGARTVSLIDVPRKRVDWLWPGRVPSGMLTLLVGREGVGKSQLAVMLAATVSQQGGSVLLLTAEDDPGATVRPRAEAANADLSRLHVATMRQEGMDTGLVLPDHAADLDRLAQDHCPRLVVIDPIAAHLGGGINSWRDQDIRTALAPLHRLAERHGCAILIVAHLNKSQIGDAGQRTGGSIGLNAAVRSSLLLARDPSDPDGERGLRRCLAHSKCNIGPQAETLSFEIQSVVLDDGSESSRFVRLGTSNVSTAELLATPGSTVTTPTKADQAAEFLQETLADGPRTVTQLQREAEAAGIAWRTLERAKKKLGVDAVRVEGAAAAGEWMWALTTPVSTDGGLSDFPYDRHMRDIGGVSSGPASERPSEAVEPGPVANILTQAREKLGAVEITDEALARLVGRSC